MEKNKTIAKIRALLDSKNIAEITEGLNKANELAVIELMPEIATVFSINPDNNLRKQITLMFNDMKQSKAIPVLASLINETKDADTLKMLVSAAWQCGLDFSEHTAVFIPLLLSDDFSLSFDAYTVIESNIDFMDKAKAEITKTQLGRIRKKLPEKIELLYEGLIEQLDSVS